MSVEFILLALVAYLLGSVPAAYLAGRWSRGVDIRKYGGGNVGAGNAWRFASKPLAVVVIVFDLGKGMVMVWAAQQAGLGIAEQVVAGVAVVIGHNWPVFLRFSGGRGVLTTLGVALVLPVINNLVPWGLITGLAIAALFFFILRDSALGVGLAFAAMPLVSWGLGEPTPLPLGFLAMFLIVLFRRLTAPRTSLSASVPQGELLVSRLLFDRDIRDREAWLHQGISVSQLAARQGKQRKG